MKALVWLAAVVLVGAVFAAVIAGRPGWALGLLVLVVMLLVGSLRARAPGETQKTEPVRMPPADAELSEGPVWACLRCGSPTVRALRASEGMIPGGGDMLMMTCGRCQQRGPAVEFDDPTAYRQFVKALHEDKAEAEKKTDPR